MKKIMWHIVVVVVMLFLINTSNSFAVQKTSKYVRDCVSWFYNHVDGRRTFEGDSSHILGFGTGVMLNNTKFEWFAWQNADGLSALVLNKLFSNHTTRMVFCDSSGVRWDAMNYGKTTALPFCSFIYQYHPNFQKGNEVNDQEILDRIIRMRFPFVKRLEVSQYWYWWR